MANPYWKYDPKYPSVKFIGLLCKVYLYLWLCFRSVACTFTLHFRNIIQPVQVQFIKTSHGMINNDHPVTREKKCFTVK